MPEINNNEIQKIVVRFFGQLMKCKCNAMTMSEQDIFPNWYFVALSAIFYRTETVSWVEMEFLRSFFQFQAIREQSSRIITLQGIEKSFKELQFQPRKKFQFCQK